MVVSRTAGIPMRHSILQIAMHPIHSSCRQRTDGASIDILPSYTPSHLIHLSTDFGTELELTLRGGEQQACQSITEHWTSSKDSARFIACCAHPGDDTVLGMATGSTSA